MCDDCVLFRFACTAAVLVKWLVVFVNTAFQSTTEQSSSREADAVGEDSIQRKLWPRSVSCFETAHCLCVIWIGNHEVKSRYMRNSKILAAVCTAVFNLIRISLMHQPF